MAIALIGAILKRNASEQKWESIAEKLKKSHYHLHAAVRLQDWNYQHPTLNASIELRSEHEQCKHVIITLIKVTIICRYIFNLLAICAI